MSDFSDSVEFSMMTNALDAIYAALDRPTPPEADPEEETYSERELPSWQRGMHFTDPDQAGGFIGAQQ